MFCISDMTRVHREGVLGQDADLAQWLRKNCTAPVLLAANKAERRGASGASGNPKLTCMLPDTRCSAHDER